jgi:hypothetical protein
MTDKQLILKYIENITMYEKDYDTLNMLYNTNDRFFVRVMTEIAKGNLLLSDFESLIGGPSYDTVIEDKFILSAKVQEDLNMILEANDAVTSFDEGLNKSIYENLLVSTGREALMEEVQDEEVYNFFKHTPESSLLFRIHKEKLLAQYNSGNVSPFFLNAYIGVPIIPINYNDVILTEDDKLFALSKGIDINEAKKIKSLSYYYRGKGE